MDIVPFGKVDIENLEEYYDGELQIRGNPVEVDLNFESKSIEQSVLEKIEKFLHDIEAFANKSFEEISKDFDLGEESETARFYLQHHLEEFDEDEVLEIFGTKDVDKQTFIKNLSLRRIGIYPENDESYAVFDIQLPEEYTNYLTAVTFDSDGELSYISMDS